MQKGKIQKIIDKNAQEVHLGWWKNTIVFCENAIFAGYPMTFYSIDDGTFKRTTDVQDIISNRNDLTVITRNSVYYIERLKEPFYMQ